MTPEEMEVAVFTDEKQKREENIREIKELEKLLQKTKNGLPFWMRQSISIRKKQCAR